MKCLSFQQPWLFAVFHLGKPIENRKWALPPWMIGQPCLFHASKTIDIDGIDYLVDLHRQGLIERLPDLSEIPMSAILGQGTFTGCTHIDLLREETLFGGQEAGFWHFGPYCWPMEGVQEFETPIPWKGELGFFDVPDEVVREALCL